MCSLKPRGPPDFDKCHRSRRKRASTTASQDGISEQSPTEQTGFSIIGAIRVGTPELTNTNQITQSTPGGTLVRPACQLGGEVVSPSGRGRGRHGGRRQAGPLLPPCHHTHAHGGPDHRAAWGQEEVTTYVMCWLPKWRLSAHQNMCRQGLVEPGSPQSSPCS